MSNAVVDQNLLFGLLALQNAVITREHLVAAFGVWMLDKSRVLSEILIEQKALTPERQDQLQQMLHWHIQLHGQDPAQSLAKVSSASSACQMLAALGDADIQASLRPVFKNSSSANLDAEDPFATVNKSDGTGPGLRYHTLRPHAKGGLGEVSVAMDSELHREVALKEIQAQYADDQQSRERFVMEAEITGGLEHPGIVPVYGLGSYSDGRPFYAMRFIKGDSLKEALTEYHSGTALAAGKPGKKQSSSERQFQLRKLLGRFIDVCNAIEYAHSRGVLHRDLKPGNIMLGKYGETLVVDWGLAKSVGKQDLASDEAAFQAVSPLSNSGMTQRGQAVGTPAYMSPEQAAGNLNLLGPPSDVYCLGATLYHVLTGHPPFEDQDIGVVMQRVQKGDCLPPRQRDGGIPQPLEAICLKAMALKPGNRYSSARALADDLEHWLADEPVGAHLEGILARSSRWIRKHRAWAFSGAAALAVVAVVATISALFISVQKGVIVEQEREARLLAARNQQLATDESAARRRADEKADEARNQHLIALEQSRRADDEATRAKESESFMRQLFTSSDPTGLTGAGLLPAGEGRRNVTAMELLNRGASLMRTRFQSPSRKDQLTRAAIASSIGDVSRALGLLDQAQPLLREALRIRQTLLPPDDPEIVLSQLQLANWHTERGDLLEAEKLYSAALASHQRKGTQNGLEAAEVQLRMAVLLTSIGDSRGEQFARAGLATRNKLLGRRHRDTVVSRMVLASSLMDQQKTYETVMLGLSTFSTRVDALIGLYRMSKERAVAAVLEYQLALILSRLDFRDLAIGRSRHAVEQLKQALGPKHLYVSILLFDLGTELLLAKQDSEAEKVFSECLDVAKVTAGIEHPRAIKLLATYGDMLARLERAEESSNLVNEALVASDNRYGKLVPWRFRLTCLAAVMAAKAKRHELAAMLGAESLASLETRTRPLEWDDRMYLARMAWMLGVLPDLTLCRQAYKRVFELKERREDPEQWWTDNLNFGEILVEHKLYGEAEPYLREAARMAVTPAIQRIEDFASTTNSLYCLAKVDWAAGRFPEAEAHFREALVELRKIGTAAHPFDLLGRLINFLLVRQRFDDAIPLLEQYGRRTDLSASSRTWGLFLRIALSETAASPLFTKSILAEFEKIPNAAAVPDAVMYQARSVVILNGNVARELERIDALPQNDAGQEALLLARAACGLRLAKPDIVLESLDRVKSPILTDSKSFLRLVYKALAVYRRDANDLHQNNLRAAVELAEKFLENTKNLKDPNIGGYAVSNQLELRWWCRQIRQDLQTKAK